MVLAHIVVLSAALLTLLCLPCVVAVVVCADELVLRRALTRRGRRELRALRRLDRAFAAFDPVPALAALDAPSIEQIAFDLRRLDRQRRTGPTRESERWLAAVLRAYDERLCLACRCLGLTEHLLPLEGMDRDIERVRVEGQLQAAGLALRA
ncbi:hypothetical protein ACWKSP_19685 [Micromonosporaceae bacterium Da 78-11]